MATIIAPGTKTIPAYPAAAVAAALTHELLATVRRRFRRKGIPHPKSDTEIIVMTVELDSLTVVEMLSCLDDILPFQVTESVVKAGGYDSIEEAVKHVTVQVEKRWDKYHRGEKR